MSEKERITKLHGKKMQRFNAKSCMSLFLCAVLLFTSIDYTQAQAEEATGNEASVHEVSDSTVRDENITENPVNPNEETESANDAESGKDTGADADTGNETSPETADGTDTGNNDDPTASDGTGTENKDDSETTDGTDTGNNDDSENTDGTENAGNPADGDDADKKDESGSNDDDKDSEDSGSSSETDDTENPENPENPDGSNEDDADGEDEGDTPTENPDGSDKKDKDKDKGDSPQEGEGTDEIQFVTTAEGAIIISSFEPLQETASKIVLDKKLPLDELTAMMPQTLKAYAYAYTTTGNKADEASSTDTAPAAEIQKKLKNAVSALTKGKSETGTTASTNDNSETGTAASINDNSETETAVSTNDNSETGTAASANDNSETGTAASANGSSEEETTASTNDSAEDKTTADTSNQTDGKETSLHELEIPVSWECSEDYDNTELESYNFTPNWDNAAYSYETANTAGEAADENTSEETNGGTTEETSEETSALPMITVTFDKNAAAVTVSTQKELEEAFASGASKIVLAEDISLTRTLTLPASADILFDGQGFSLTRGKDENGVFIGTMIYMGGDDYTKKGYGKLTLTDICIDGTTPNNRTGSSTIIDHGSLTLDKDAYIKNNSSYGTYEYDDNGKLQTLVADFGGGVQVYGELKVTEHSLITGNFADEFGGGVYLAGESVLYLYADVIKENSVAEGTGYGADLYAASGSTIYYDSSIDMEREGFYICEGAELICLQETDEEAGISLLNEEQRNDEKVEFYVSVAGGSGYNIEEIEAKLAALGPQYSVVSKRTDIDITDSKNWYVYDHYDTNTNCWKDLTTDTDSNGRPDTWEAYYDYNSHRGYYPVRESNVCTIYTDTQYKRDEEGNLVKDDNGNYIYETIYVPVQNPAYTIPEWMASNEYTYNGYKQLSAFKEHIYQGKQGGHPMMIFAGYGQMPYVDFMFYDPQSTGEKVVDFDVDSSKVNTHTLTGAGFLVNATEKVNDIGQLLLNGYLVYYDYAGSSSTYPKSVSIYYLNDINAVNFHNGTYNLWDSTQKNTILGSPLIDPTTNKVATYAINSMNWENEMSVQIKVTTNSIEVRQQPKDSSTNIALSTPVITLKTSESANSGFGPLVAYTSHNCALASSFTYSNLSMYYTNPIYEGQSILQELEKADYTQSGTQKYFINLFGKSNLDYNNEGVESWMYQDFLKLMQIEGVALITDRDTSFEEYLGESGNAGSNLCEITENVTVDELVNLIKEYVEQEQQTTTYIQNKLQSDENPDGLTNATPSQPVGNCWLKEASRDRQVRVIGGDSLPESGYTIQIMDDISYRHEGSTITGITYEVFITDGAENIKQFTVSPSETASFVVGKDAAAWPAGQYTVRQTIHTSNGDAKVQGYAYFEIKRNDEPEHEHQYSEWTIDIEPTCITTGLKSRYCEICGEPQEESLSLVEHKPNDNFDYDETGHWHACSVCNTPLDAAPHEPGDWVADKDKHWHECSICGAVIDETEHEFGDWLHDNDKHWRECSICGAKTEAVEHELGEWLHDDDKHWHKCICGYITDEVEHEFGEWLHDDDKHWRECICGVKIGETEHTFDEWGYNAAKHWHACSICGARTEAVEHEFGEWVHNDGKHWRECICGAKTDEAEHAFEKCDYNETSHWHECICGVKTEAEIHEGEWITDKEATEDEEGSKHRICDICKYREDLTISKLPHVHIYGDWLSNETSHWRECIKHDNRIDEAVHDFGEWITDIPATEEEEGSQHRICDTCKYREDEIIPKLPHVHIYGDWLSNETSHWKECVKLDDRIDEAPHQFGEWIIDSYATEDADGQKHRECSVCEYIERDVIKLGNVTKREDCGENAPRTVISTELRAVASVTLENEDIQEVKSGKDIDIILTVDDAGDTVSASDQTAITSVMGSYKLGQYLDVNLYKELNNNKSWITETKNVIRLVLDVPETLKKANSKLPRSFVMIRVHDGNAVILEDLDSDDNTITIDTDRFSTYAIVYADKKSAKRSRPVKVDNTPDNNQIIDSFIEFVTVSAPPVAANKDAEPKTGNNSHVKLYATIALIEGLSYLTYLFTFKYGMTEEKKNELIARLIEWAKHGGRLRRIIAIASIFMLLLYYHSIGKHTNIEWTQVYD